MTILIAMPWLPSSPTAVLWRKYLIYGIMGLGLVTFLCMPLLKRRITRGLRTVLTEGPWWDMTMNLAVLAGVRVKQVVLVKSSTCNAFVSALGTVGVTTALIAKLEPEEVRAIIAHELGHIKGGHPGRTLLLSLLSSGVLLALWIGLRFYLNHHVPQHMAVAFNNPVLFVVLANIVLMLLIGPIRRRWEAEADRYAVLWIGDPEIVIRALTKIHTLNASPHRLKPSDEALHSHPSLFHRIEAIRKSHSGL